MKSRWSYKVIPISGEYGPFRCEIYFCGRKIDDHTGCSTKTEAKELGVFWTKWLRKCDKTLLYDPHRFPKWLDWYQRAYGCTAYPSMYCFDDKKQCSIRKT